MDMRLYLFLFLLLALAACDRGERPEAPTAAETARLDEAESMLDNLGKQKEPENAAAPSGPKNRADEESGR